MADRFASYAELAAFCLEGIDYRVRTRAGSSGVLVLAPHGGGIEPGTSEIADAVAGAEHSFYAFEGLRARDNALLHVTSTRFDEPRALALVATARAVLVVHGTADPDPVAFVGGRDDAGAKRVRAELAALGWRAEPAARDDLQGRDPRNLCNRGASGAGVQIELGRGLRRQMFRGLDTAGRARPTARLNALVRAVRSALAEAPWTGEAG